MTFSSSSDVPCASDPSLLDPCNRDPAARDALLQWLRVQAAFGFRPQDACAALLRGVPAKELWGLAAPEARARAGQLKLDDPYWRALEACGAKALPWTSQHYPERLRRLSDAPPLLFVQGDPALLRRRCVAVVGARAASAYGRRIARELGAALADAGIVVVSGLAYGIDACAHSGALEAGGPTLAVQGRGPDDVYPTAHRPLARRIQASGALLSEFAPGVPPRAPHFPLRNRIISALSEAVVVVEARTRSGSLVTARHAADQGVDVLAVPGPVDAPSSEGTNRLLRDGAGCILGPDDVLRALGLEPASAGGRTGRTARTGQLRRPSPPPDDASRRLVAALRDAPATRDELATRLGSPPEALALALAELELLGWVEPGHDGRLRLTRSVLG